MTLADSKILQKSPRPRRRWLRFSLRTLLLLVTVLGIWLGVKVDQARRQKEAVAALRDLGATIYYEHQRSNINPREFSADKELGLPRWLRDLAGDDFFRSAVVVELSLYRELTDKDLIHLGAFPNIEKLSFHRWGDRVTDAGMAHLPRPNRLVDLFAHGTSIGDGFVKRLANASQLEQLYLDRTRVTADGLRSLVGLTSLKILSLSDTNLGDDALEALPPLRSLVSMYLDGTPVTDAGLAHLARHKALTSVMLNRTAIGDAGLKHLATLPRLSHLNLYGTQVRGPGLADIAPHLNGRLDLRKMPIDDAGLAYLRDAKSLQTLRLEDTAITDAGLAHLYSLPGLRLVVLGGTKVTDAGKAKLAKAKPGLRILDRPMGK